MSSKPPINGATSLPAKAEVGKCPPRIVPKDEIRPKGKPASILDRRK